MNRGFTLIESLIYIALLGLIMSGALLTTYQLIESAEQVNAKTVIDEEANFILRKFDYALTGATAINVSATPPYLRVIKAGGNLEFILAGDDLKLDSDLLNSEDVKMANLVFTHTNNSTKPDELKISFELNGQQFESTKYLRQ